MNLGIVVVYLVAEEDGKLLDLHLDQIQKHTSVPYVIYAGTKRLLPKFAARLQGRSEVKICSLDSTDLRNAAENSFYLDQLVEIAVEDGATHVVTMHLDSFPIRDRWAEELASRAADKAFATVDRGPYSSCLFFTREFYFNHHPRFLLSETEYSTKLYQKFSEQHEHILHSGIGFLYRAFADDLEWYSLTESDRHDAFGVVYDGLIFHLHGNVRLLTRPADILGDPITARILYKLRALTRKMVPRRARRVLWENFGDCLSLLDERAMQLAKRRLLENPERFLVRFQMRDK